MGPRARGGWRVGLAVALIQAALLLPGAPAAPQEAFRLAYTVDRHDPTRVRITGVVYNDAPVEMRDVYVSAEALDGGGRVVARGLSFVAGLIPERGSAPFVVSVPGTPGAARFRVRVSSFRPGLGLQSP